MIRAEIPGYGILELEHLVLDYNGTLALDGKLIAGVGERIERLSAAMEIHVLTADTFGSARSGLGDLPCSLVVLPEKDQAQAKLERVRALGAETTACIGNGRNDRLMLKEAALGIAVVLEEGAAREAVEAADIVCTSVEAALDLMVNPLRLVATLRS